ncbi:hypothetical protein ACRJ4W_08705 [Streptomyces sp. GLT-R25]
MKRFTITTTVAALSLALSGAAQGHERTAERVAPGIQELVGQGTGDCPSMSLCLYEDHDLNKDKSARIWVFFPSRMPVRTIPCVTMPQRTSPPRPT